jgi:hypothetical protein
LRFLVVGATEEHEVLSIGPQQPRHRIAPDGSLVGAGNMIGTEAAPGTFVFMAWVTAPVWVPLAVMQTLMFVVVVLALLAGLAVTAVDETIQAVQPVIVPLIWAMYVVGPVVLVGTVARGVALVSAMSRSASEQLAEVTKAIVWTFAFVIVAFGFVAYFGGIRPHEHPSVGESVSVSGSGSHPIDIRISRADGRCRFVDSESGRSLDEITVRDGDTLSFQADDATSLSYRTSGWLSESYDFDVPGEAQPLLLVYRLDRFPVYPGVPRAEFSCEEADRPMVVDPKR